MVASPSLCRVFCPAVLRSGKSTPPFPTYTPSEATSLARGTSTPCTRKHRGPSCLSADDSIGAGPGEVVLGSSRRPADNDHYVPRIRPTTTSCAHLTTRCWDYHPEIGRGKRSILPGGKIPTCSGRWRRHRRDMKTLEKRSEKQEGFCPSGWYANSKGHTFPHALAWGNKKNGLATSAKGVAAQRE